MGLSFVQREIWLYLEAFAGLHFYDRVLNLMLRLLVPAEIILVLQALTNDFSIDHDLDKKFRADGVNQSLTLCDRQFRHNDVFNPLKKFCFSLHNNYT